MFTALFSTIMSAFSDVFWKKSLSYKVGERAHEIGAYPIVFILVSYFIFTGFNFASTDFIVLAIVILIVLLDIIIDPISQQIYREEKISVIMPYLNLSKIFIIISSFFLYNDVSNITFCITLLAIVIIIFVSIDFKNKRFPKNFGKILFIEVFSATGALLGGWLILGYSEVMYFNLYAIIYLIPTCFLAYRSQQIGDLVKQPLTFWWYKSISSLGWFSWFLSLVVIKDLGLSLSILLGFLGIGVTLLISYIFLKDKPSQKNIWLTIVVSLLIGIGYYFK